MPSDPLQIALEHHRAGRLRQAEAGYRAITERDPTNADAAHWLAVLWFQAGRAEQAVPLLQRATTLRPEDPAFHYNLAQAYLECGQSDQAIAELQQAARLDPERAEILLLLGRAHLSRHGVGDADAAVSVFGQVQKSGLDTPELQHDLGVALLAAGRTDEAIASLKASLSLKAESASAYHHLATAYRVKDDPREVRKNLNKALELDPKLARAWYDLAMLDAMAGNLAVAAGLFRKAVAVKPDFSAAWDALGKVLVRLGRNEEAGRAFDRAARSARGELAGGEAGGIQSAGVEDLERKLNSTQLLNVHFALAARYPVFTPATLPRSSLSDLFNGYAKNFDQMLVEKLHYRVPEQIAEAIARVRANGEQKAIDILDLGCGTGLCGRLLKPIARRLCGVDLSPGMIEKARERAVYDQLDVGELLDVMKRAPRCFDLIISADVFIYVGDLAEVYEAAAAALRPGGLFVFSVEAGGGDRYNLTMRVRRYTHSAPYLRRLAAICGFEEVSFDPVVIRYEAGEVVPGWLPVFRLTG